MKNFELYQYSGYVIEVYDGDTCTVEFDLGFKVHFTEKVRLLGINAPEIRGAQREQGIISRDNLRKRILEKNVYIETVKDEKEKYGRYLGILYLKNEDGTFENINEWMVEKKLAVYASY